SGHLGTLMGGSGWQRWTDGSARYWSDLFQQWTAYMSPSEVAALDAREAEAARARERAAEPLIRDEDLRRMFSGPSATAIAVMEDLERVRAVERREEEGLRRAEAEAARAGAIRER